LEPIYQFAQPFRTADGASYEVQVLGEAEGGVWYGWLDFVPVNGDSVLATDRETTQPSREALAYWATGLEEIYLEGAFERARRRAVAASSTVQDSGSMTTP
jgi:hypothetical protein